uniref:Peptidase S1 domain-containing protein n=1 Tax=Anopheles dirus TaxID=7168 RepID=A0A182N9N9_9DIPT
MFAALDISEPPGPVSLMSSMSIGELDDRPPDMSVVKLLNSATVIEIRNVVLHPNYTEGSVYNNIAVLKLASVSNVVPICLNFDDRAFNKRELFPHVIIKTNDSIRFATINTNAFKNSSHRLCEEYPSAISFGSEHLCFFNEEFIVPDTCQQHLGLPIEAFHNEFAMFGMYMKGEDCGFGEPALGLRLGAHKAWLESVLLKKRDSSVSFIDTDLWVRDECKYADGTQGICVPQANCSGILERIQRAQQIIYCRSGAVVCCPRKASNPRISAIEQEFDECAERYMDLTRKRSNEMTHIMEIGLQNSSNRSSNCIGYLISTRGVVTSASCLLESDTPYNVVRLHANEYDKNTQSNNIAVVKLASAITPTSRVFPACLWQNVTHSPVHQEVFNSDLKLFNAIFPVFRSDCETILQRSLAAPEICMKLLWENYKPTCPTSSPYIVYFKDKIKRKPNTHCLKAGYPVVWKDYRDAKFYKQTLDYTEYLLGVYSSGECESSASRIVERVAMHIDWLKEALQ